MDGICKSTLAKQLLIHVRNQFDFACFLEFEDIQTKPKWEDIEKLVARNLFRGREKSRLVITTCVKGFMSQYGFIEHDVPFMSRLESEELFKGQIRSSLRDALLRMRTANSLDEIVDIASDQELNIEASRDDGVTKNIAAVSVFLDY
ncbi:hypothetical protein R1flu_015842 [Riccia fluitans]|uniref:Uncharacterized protein n=1 Tax=Riccia fluitans TaxID=41844 RepID=A0ABD1YK47_9MARC